jgi:hypothetical protein
VHLLEIEYRKVSSMVNTLLDFHSSFEISLASASRQDLHLSCPVLSYVYDSDDDSIEINKAKRPSLTSNSKRNETFKIANDIVERILIQTEIMILSCYYFRTTRLLKL